MRALESTVDGRHCRLQRSSGLARRPVEDVTHDEDRALSGWQVLDGGEKCELGRLAREQFRLGLVVIGRGLLEQQVGERLEPGQVGHRMRRLGGVSRTRDVGRQNALWSATESVKARVGRDAIEPRAEGRASIVAGAHTPGANEGFMHEIYWVMV